jgi:hypothetical protein
VMAPTGVEISNDGTTWHTTLTEDETSGTLASTTIYVRISASASAGPLSSNVTNVSSGATTQDVAVTGTVNAAITVGPSSLPVATEGNSYSEALTASGGSGTGYMFMATGLPMGLTLSAGGLLSGTPTDSSETPYTVDVTVADSENNAGSMTYMLTVDPALSISPSTLPSPTVGSSYGEQLTASGGSGSDYTFTATGLPPDLAISENGLITGDPSSAPGTPYTVIVTVMDGNSGTGTETFSMSVKEAAQAGDIVASAPQTYYGQNVTLTATFSATAAGMAPMTGTVAFYDGDTYLGTAPLEASSGDEVQPALAFVTFDALATASGESVLPITELAVGNHTFIAYYSGDANYSAAISETPVSVQVVPTVTSTTLTSSTTAQGTTLKASVVVTSPGDPTVDGNVSFYNDGTLLGTEPVVGGVATLNAGVLAQGTYAFTAVYSGGGTSSASGGTLVLSTAGPRVTSVLRYGFHAQPTYLVLTFDSPLDRASAQNVANYKIVGPNGRHIKVKKATYNATTQTVTLAPAERISIQHSYRLTVNGESPSGLTNPAGTLLDGAGDGQPGTDYRTSLTWRNLRGSAGERPPALIVKASARDLFTRVGSSFHKRGH